MALVPSARSAAENEQAAAMLSGQVIGCVRYFPLPVYDGDDTPTPGDWDFGVWHEPAMGVELVTGSGQVFSATWGQYEWGFGVDLLAGPMSEHLIADQQIAVDVSSSQSWTAILGKTVTARFLWDDYGNDLAPCPEALVLDTDRHAAWIIAAGWERQQGRTCIQLGLDDLLVVFDEKFARALGLLDENRGNAEHSR
jgi:hypothetical protein